MSRLNPSKLHVRFSGAAGPAGPILSRRYTLTHSDATGDLYLTIGADYDRKQISGLYTRLMRDEVLAEWCHAWTAPGQPSTGSGATGLGSLIGSHASRFTLHLYCHVSGGLILGSADTRDAIFQRELPLVLEAFRRGDRGLFEAHPELDRAPIYVHFRSDAPRHNRVEHWGTPADYWQGASHASR